MGRYHHLRLPPLRRCHSLVAALAPFLLLGLLLLRAGHAQQVASLERDAELGGLSDCVQHCIRGGWLGHLPLYNNLGCGGARAHSCVCHAERRAQADRFFRKCLSTDLRTAMACVTQDHAVALSLFDRYCGFGPATTTTPTPTPTPTTAVRTASGGARVTAISGPTSVASSDAASMSTSSVSSAASSTLDKTSPSTTSTASQKASEQKPVGLIAGLSVGLGLFGLALIAFAFWRFCRPHPAPAADVYAWLGRHGSNSSNGTPNWNLHR